MPGNIMTIPLEVFGNWPKPNYVDPVRREWMPIYTGILQGVMTIMLSLRLWLRFQNRAGALGLDDVRTHQQSQSMRLLTTNSFC
jgi:hypothetical protein